MARRRDAALWLILVLSLAVHLLLITSVWPLLREALRQPPQEKVSLDLRFRTPPEEEPEEKPEEKRTESPEQKAPPEQKEPPKEERHLPRDTGKETDLKGTAFDDPSEESPLAGEQASGDADAGAGSGGKDVPEPRPEPESRPAPEPDPQPEMPDPILRARESDQRDALSEQPQSPEERETTASEDPGMILQEESTEDRQQGEELVSELEKRRIEMANRYLREMQQQILRFWQRPRGADALHKGEIRFSVDSRGRLTGARISRPSGHQLLDISALEAVRSVRDYAVPDRPDIVQRYYQDMIFSYSGAPLSGDRPE